ncbi:glycosyltransferase [Leuconostoc mesenteroides]|uniref:glycosyltransferase n=1 Tax=Leuconostoc mesenteroides TaxID=1245 RepID=UPI00235F91D7|nr:glycosyltransferase [Leuconostoc mesenteroides]
MLHILQLPGTLSRSNGRMTVIMNIYREIIKKDIQFDFLVTEVAENDYSEEIRKLGGKIFSLPSGKDTLFTVRRKMREVLSNSSYRYDVIHYHAISSWGIAIDIPYRKKIKVITHSHATKLSDTLLKSLRNRLFSLNIFFNSNQFVACSPEAGDKLFMGRSFTYLPNAINIENFLFDEEKRKTYRKMLSIKSNQLVIGNVGRIAKQKNQLFLLKILVYLLERGIDTKLVIVGDGNLKKNLQHEINSAQLQNNVVLAGAVKNPGDYYSAMDVFLLPSLFEGLPMVGVEAQANGLPSIFSSQTSQCVNMFNASFVDLKEKNVRQWFEAILSHWEGGRDESAIKHIKKQKFDIYSGVSEWTRLYEILIQ